MAYANGLLEDEEFLILYDDFKPNPSYPYWDFDPFSVWIHLILASAKPTFE